MLVGFTGKCDKCGSTDGALFQQEASVTCKKCGGGYKLCRSCKAAGCPNCGGKLESKMDWAAKNNVMF